MGSVDQTLLWLDKAYGDTMELLQEAEKYHSNDIQDYLKQILPAKRLLLTNESLRITSRLSHTMAWLMSEKAIRTDQAEREEMEEIIDPLQDEYVSLRPREDVVAEFPQTMLHLMERSFEVYERALRLENMLRSKDQAQAS